MNPYREPTHETNRPARSATLVAVWKQMAEHFLDTDNRELIPRTAAVCIEAGLDTTRARAVWRYDVAPALAGNLWTSGEWLGWDEARLVARIEELRARWDNELPWRWISYWLIASPSESTWRSIARVMKLLEREANTDQRRQLAEDLARLARMYFAWSNVDLAREASAAAAHRTRLGSLYHESFGRLLAPVVSKEQAERGHRRVLHALGEGPSPFDDSGPSAQLRPRNDA